MVAKNYIFGRKYGSALLTNLVAYYNLDANANDVVNSHNGTSTNISYANAGINGNCATFNGTSSLITIPQTTDFDFSTVSNDLPFTISVWLNYSTGGIAEILNKQDGTNVQWLMRRVSNYLAFGIFTNYSNYKYYQFPLGTLIVGNWYHAVFVYDGFGTVSSLTLYLNNSVVTGPVNNIGTYTKMPISSQPLIVGRSGSSSSLFYNGKIDEIAIWKNRELNATEVAELYNTGTGKFYPF